MARPQLDPLLLRQLAEPVQVVENLGEAAVAGEPVRPAIRAVSSGVGKPVVEPAWPTKVREGRLAEIRAYAKGDEGTLT